MEWLGWTLILLPAVVGVANAHLPAAIVSAAIGFVALLIGLVLPIVGIPLWLFAFYVGFRAVNLRDQRRLEDRRHREMLAAISTAKR